MFMMDNFYYFTFDMMLVEATIQTITMSLSLSPCIESMLLVVTKSMTIAKLKNKA